MPSLVLRAVGRAAPSEVPAADVDAMEAAPDPAPAPEPEPAAPPPEPVVEEPAPVEPEPVVEEPVAQSARALTGSPQ